MRKPSFDTVHVHRMYLQFLTGRFMYCNGVVYALNLEIDKINVLMRKYRQSEIVILQPFFSNFSHFQHFFFRSTVYFNKYFYNYVFWPPALWFWISQSVALDTLLSLEIFLRAGIHPGCYTLSEKRVFGKCVFVKFVMWALLYTAFSPFVSVSLAPFCIMLFIVCSEPGMTPPQFMWL